MQKCIYFLFFLLIAGNVACSHKKNEAVDINLDVIDMENLDIDETCDTLGYIYFKCKNHPDQFGVADNYTLSKLHYHQYSNMNFNVFQNKVLSGEIALDCEENIACVTLNDTVTEMYNKHELSDFIDFYYNRNEVDTETLFAKNQFSENTLLSVFYYMNQNRYCTGYDCYYGYYISTHRASLY